MARRLFLRRATVASQVTLVHRNTLSTNSNAKQKVAALKISAAVDAQLPAIDTATPTASTAAQSQSSQLQEITELLKLIVVGVKDKTEHADSTNTQVSAVELLSSAVTQSVDAAAEKIVKALADALVKINTSFNTSNQHLTEIKQDNAQGAVWTAIGVLIGAATLFSGIYESEVLKTQNKATTTEAIATEAKASASVKAEPVIQAASASATAEAAKAKSNYSRFWSC